MNRFYLARLAGIFFACTATAQETTPLTDQPLIADPPASSPAPEAVVPAASDEAQRERLLLSFFKTDPAQYTMISVSRGLSTHKPMFIMPFTYSSDYEGDESEVLFSLSAKQRLFNRNLYFGYSQKSFWQLYNKEKSSPFRATDYNPEMFYRWTPEVQKYRGWGADFGFEHESNGQQLPLSRSWNRLYVAPFQARGPQLLYFKFWYRIPEDEKADPLDARGDDNPDISKFYGYGEVRLQRQFAGTQQIALMARGNPKTGKGAASINYSIAGDGGALFYQLYLWSGYGESLADYNRSVTRIGLGIMLAR